ncbi:hypothetical protein LEP1GSC017_2374 [Leptospira meyeri serovar Hardjo str. Went 5]|nr:hypothetical protein LEP1GSC017_2374 [Leptospira meyeri serovar Hardjo str. Went 5]
MSREDKYEENGITKAMIPILSSMDIHSLLVFASTPTSFPKLE